MNELFPTEAITRDSPRLAWMKKHGVITYYSNVEPATWFAGLQEWWPEKTGGNFFIHEWGYNGDTRVGQGDTEDEAMTDMLTSSACKHMRHWTL